MIIEWDDLRVVAATVEDARLHAAALATAYNEPRNAPLLGHTALLSTDDVVKHYADLITEGGHPFLLFRDGRLAGDGDLRAPREGAREFAFLIANPDAQGKGLGTRFATMICAAGFAHLELRTIYASVVPANVASRRVFEKLGFVLDASAEAQSFADEDDDLVLSIDRATFEKANAAALSQIAIGSRA